MLEIIIKCINKAMVTYLMLLMLAHLFVKLLQPGDSEGTLRSSSQAVTYYYQSNHSKVEAIPLSALPKYSTSELSDPSSRFPFFS